jgi:hypothetical protein
MRVAQSLALTAPRGAFSPARLFAGGVAGAWYDPADLGTLFQDDARTVPVTASGQTVGGIADKSGNGNHLAQATASFRPVYTESGGLRFLQFDGVDDRLDCAALAASWAGRVETFSGLRLTGGTTFYPHDCVTGGRLSHSGVTASAASLFRTATASFTPSPALAVNTDYVFTAIGDGANSIVGVNAQISGALNAGASTVASLRIGARQDMAQRHTGRIYGLALFHATLTAAQQSAMRSWMAARSGVTL